MKKNRKLTAALVSAALMITAVSGAFLTAGMAAASGSSKIGGELSALIDSSEDEYFPVWVYLADKEASVFTSLTGEEKLEAVKKYYREKNNSVIADLGIEESRISYISMFTPSFICELTAEQIQQADADERVASINLYDRVRPTEDGMMPGALLTKEQFLDLVVSEDEDFSDGGFVYGRDLKYDAYKDGNGDYQLIIYGVKEEDYTPAVGVSDKAMKLNTRDYQLSPIEIGFWSGYNWDVIPGSGGASAFTGRFCYAVYVENVLPGIATTDIVKACMNKPYDIVPYIYPEITSGDIDNDGMITASDASLVLEAYSCLSTGTSLTLNSTLFDYNGDGQTDSADASEILVKYAEASTEKKV